MSEWKLKLFRDIAQFPPKVLLEKSKSYPFIPMEDIDGVTKYVSPKSERVWNGTGGAKFENGDTLFARITPCLQNGKISQAKNLKDGKGFGSTEYFIFRGIEEVSDNDFIYYLSQTEDFRKYAIGSMVGASGRQRADATFVGQYEVNLPSVQTQKRIASILSAYDDLIESNLKRIKLLEELAQRTYEEWFVKFRVNGVQLEVGENGLPEGWEKKRLEECIVNFDNKRKPLAKMAREERKGNYPYYGAAGIIDYLDDFIFTGRHLLIGEDGTVITPKGNAMLQFVEGKFWVSNHAHVIIGKDYFSTEFIYCFLNKYPISQHITGAAQPKISQSNLNRIETIVANREVMILFQDKILPVINQIFNLKKQNLLLKESRDILLPRLMSGKIDVEKAKEELETLVIPLPKEKTKEASKEFKEAVLISVLTEKFGSEKYPLGRMRYTKLSYLFHRHADNQIADYLRKAAGPYNPRTKYAGPEKIAHDNGYVIDYQNGNLKGFVAGKNIDAAKTYFDKFWSFEYMNWLESQFKYSSNDELELYATVDSTLIELRKHNMDFSVENVKEIIRTEKEWKAKLEREIFSDANIKRAIDFLPTLFVYINY